MTGAMSWILAHQLDGLNPEYDQATNTVWIDLGYTENGPEIVPAASMRVEPDMEAFAASLTGMRDAVARFSVAIETVDWSVLGECIGECIAALDDLPETAPRMPPTGKGDPLAGVLRDIDQVLNEEA